MNIETIETLPAAAEAALSQGQVIQAIKIVRNVRNVDLKDAKDAVDRYMEKHPELKARWAEAQKEALGKLVKVILTLIGLAAAVFAWSHRN